MTPELPIFLCCAAACLWFAAIACVRAARVERAERLQGNLLYRVFEDEMMREEMRAEVTPQ